MGSAMPWMTTLVTFSTNGYFNLGFLWFSPSNQTASLYWFLMTAYFFIPTLSMTAIYVAAVIHSLRIQRQTGLALNSPRAVTLRDRFRVLLMLMICSAVYVVFYYIPYLYWSFGRHAHHANYFFLWLIFAHNVLNPYIFGLVQPQFREAYIRVGFWIMRKWSCRNSYGDSRRVFPAMATSLENMRPPPSVSFNASAKGSVPVLVFHQSPFLTSVNNGEISNGQATSGQLKTSVNIAREPRSIEISATRTSDSIP